MCVNVISGKAEGGFYRKPIFNHEQETSKAKKKESSDRHREILILCVLYAPKCGKLGRGGFVKNSIIRQYPPWVITQWVSLSLCYYLYVYVVYMSI